MSLKLREILISFFILMAVFPLSSFRVNAQDPNPTNAQTSLATLNSCRDRCVAKCIEQCREEQINNPGATCQTCSETQCDQTPRQNNGCYEEHQNYLDISNNLDSAKKINNLINDSKKNSDSAKAKADEGKDDMKILGLVGVAATGYLGYQTYTCCAQCAGANPVCCGMCPVWAGLTVLSGIQTKKIFNQKKKYSDISGAMSSCVSENDPNCYGDFANKLESEDTTFPPSCQDSTNKCTPVYAIVNPSAAGTSPKVSTLTDVSIPEGLDEIYQPVGGWSGGKGPFSKNKDTVDIDRLRPEQRAMVNKALANLDDQNKDFVTDQIGGSITDENGLLKKEERDGKSSPSKKTSASFTTGSEEGPVPSNEGSVVSKKSGGSLASQMQNMLNQYSNRRSKAKRNPLDGKSMRFGGDAVGVPEDNIFMMVHRRHQTLSGKNYFY